MVQGAIRFLIHKCSVIESCEKYAPSNPYYQDLVVRYKKKDALYGSGSLSEHLRNSTHEKPGDPDVKGFIL